MLERSRRWYHSRSLTLSLVANYWLFQVAAITAFYVLDDGANYASGQCAGPASAGVDAVALEGTHLMCVIAVIGDLICFVISIYDGRNAPTFPF